MSKRNRFKRGYSKREEGWRQPARKYEPPKKFDPNSKIVRLVVTDAYGDKYIYENIQGTHSPTVPGTGETDTNAYVQRVGGSVIVTFPARCTGTMTVSI